MIEKLTLAIETANPASDPEGGGVGVCVGTISQGQPRLARTLSEAYLREVGRDEDDLLPAIDRAMTAAGVRPGQLKYVAVSVGPGGFTATRMACAAGAMIAEATGAAAIAVPSAVVAHMACAAGRRLREVIAMACKGETAWCAAFNSTVWEDLEIEGRNGRVLDAVGLLGLRPARVLADAHLPAAMRAKLELARVPIMPVQFSAEACLQAAVWCSAGGPEKLVPIYPREPEAVTLWRKRHGSVDKPS
jgi:tRNA threonylcarbamoyladenosine biosynthesis protein TsaB